MNEPGRPTGRALRVALVDYAPIERDGFQAYIERADSCELVLAVAQGSALLAALQGGLLVDVVLVRFNVLDDGGGVLVEALGQQFPALRTIAMLQEPALAERAREAGATWIVPLQGLDRKGFGNLMEQVRSALFLPGER
ncbi:MAG: hypothetical protein ABI432_17705 [Flavobacteriales bacterium]